MDINEYEKEHLSRLRTLLPECAVLLKTDGLFPINRPGQLAAFGQGVRHTTYGGTGSGEVNVRFSNNVEDALEAAGFSINSKKWLDAYDVVLAKAKKNFVKEIKQRAKANHTSAVNEGLGAVMPSPEYDLELEGDGDTAIYVVSRVSGEGNDRQYIKGDIQLNDSEIRDIVKLNDTYKNFMLVLNVGGFIDISPVSNVKNILILSQLGAQTGDTLADLILGKAYPSGKLTTSWAYCENIPKIGDFGDTNENRYKEGIYVGYRYYDTVGIKNDFPFGYGLGYTSFEISDESVGYSKGKLTVDVNVKNTGNFKGKEVVQVYVSVPEEKLDQPYQELVGFIKSDELDVGETQKLSMSFDIKDLASFDDEKKALVLEKGKYIVRVGNSSVHTKVCGSFYLNETIETRKVKNCGGNADFTDWKPGNRNVQKNELDNDAIIIPIDDISCEQVNYDLSMQVDPFVEKLSDEELVYLNIGFFDPKANPISAIGMAGRQVAGAAGESSDILEKEGFPALVMADGPAGLRLSQKYAKANDRVYGFGSTLPAGLEDFMPKILVWFMKKSLPKPPKDAEICYQYCTSIPIGTAIAQSFNLELAKICGDIVGNEMERFGVNLWLAPALNIHRDIRCGRNFEYYSEDPLVSGLLAAAITEGVQKHKGCGVTIKHFVANNQERNRYTNNSIVSQRALREIYARGFEICIKKAQPHAIMTSYNLLNGVHTSERSDLSKDLLRAEFGFDGLIMTDWVVGNMAGKNSKFDVAHAANVAKAGGNLFMPGSKMDYDEMLKAVKAGEISRLQLMENVTKVYAYARMQKERT